MLTSRQRQGREKRGWIVLAAVLGAVTAVAWLLSSVQAGAAPMLPAGETAVVYTAATTPLSPTYGVNFISFPRASALSHGRYQNGLATGATWNRWALYWDDIEQSEGAFSWAYQDIAVTTDISYGLKINAILLGTPCFYRTPPGCLQDAAPAAAGALTLDTVSAGTPLGLDAPVFTDGSDIPGAGKSINEANKWSRFVFTAVSRYKPGGVLAQQQGWPAGVGITHWEMWNEPDLVSFWDGTTVEYARLLKVGYLAARQADPNAQILFGGLANAPENLGFYGSVMATFDADPLAQTYDYFHDIMATHNYLYAWESWYHVWRAGRALGDRGLSKPIWLNESGVPVWDDYPGPICEPDSPFRASMAEQAAFIVQSGLYATYAGADMLFFFQLYDDCGNQPGGTNFSYYPPEVCTPDVIEPGGDAFGLFRNPDEPIYCYTDHPQANTPRLGFDAYRMMTTYFHGVEPLWRARPGMAAGCSWPLGSQEWLAFYRPERGERLLGLWALCGQEETAVVASTAASGTATLVAPDGVTQTITATNGVFTLTLPAATNRNAPWDPNLTPIGGRPYLLIEKDTLPPALSATAVVSGVTQIALSWSGQDDGSGVAGYDVWVTIDGGPDFMALTDTLDTSAVFHTEPGHRYVFTVRARDRAGNEAETAVAAVTVTLDEHVYLPLVTR